jgi:hypothetical protein
MERQSRREAEARAGKLIDERLYTIRLELAKEKKIREETHGESYSHFGDTIHAL